MGELAHPRSHSSWFLHPRASRGALKIPCPCARGPDILVFSGLAWVIRVPHLQTVGTRADGWCDLLVDSGWVVAELES